MAINNRLATTEKKTSLASYITNDAVKNHINDVLGNPATASRFISSIVSAVQTNPNLATCSNKSIISSALLGESLKLSPSPQLGHYYLVPFNNKKKVEVDGRTEWVSEKTAQFQLGYKGYIQLAIRSGQYKKLNVVAVKEGELEYFNPFDEEIRINLIEDYEEREKAGTIGYYAMFELVNGYRKAIYWSKAQMISHAKKYSKGYDSFWGKDENTFDMMAYKTMLRQLISKYGVMSIDMQTAYTSDYTAEDSNGNRVYVDNMESDADIIDTTDIIVEDELEKDPEQEQTKPKRKAKDSSVASALFSN